MNAYAISRDYKSAISLLNTMLHESCEVKPNGIVFSIAIQACASEGKYREALDIIKKVRIVHTYSF